MISEWSFEKGAWPFSPEPGTGGRVVAFKVFPQGSKTAYDTCTCKDRKQAHCLHRSALDRKTKELAERGIPDLYEGMRKSVWDKLAQVLNDALKIPCDAVTVQSILLAPGKSQIRAYYKNQLIAEYSAHPNQADILLGVWANPIQNKALFATRFWPSLRP